MAQVLSLVGAAFVLIGFGSLNTGRLSQHDVRYHLVNLVGALALVSSALMTRTWGFVVLNVVWATVAAIGLARWFAARRAGGDPGSG